MVSVLVCTLDGKSPAPVDIVNVTLFARFYTSQVVVWDVFRQQYHQDDVQMDRHMKLRCEQLRVGRTRELIS